MSCRTLRVASLVGVVAEFEVAGTNKFIGVNIRKTKVMRYQVGARQVKRKENICI
jgi:hypothetical protein